MTIEIMGQFMKNVDNIKVTLCDVNDLSVIFSYIKNLFVNVLKKREPKSRGPLDFVGYR
jgi:hypothetical protein